MEIIAALILSPFVFSGLLLIAWGVIETLISTARDFNNIWK